MSYTPEKMDITGSPCSSTQFSENISPVPVMKTLYSKIISCKRNENLSCSITPENKFSRDSPFINQKIPFNPFNHNLKERLENPVFSPNVFSTVMSPSQDSETFKWTIDDLSKINPAPIEEEFLYEEPVDEKIESEIQNTIDKYFNKTHMVPSPWHCKLPTSWNSLREVFKAEGTVLSGNNTATSSPCSFSLSRLELVSTNSNQSPLHDVSTQTALSLPPELPESINEALKPYFIENGVDDINLSINSLRRKLVFQQEEEVLFPVRRCSSVNSSPSLNKCCPSTPLFLSRTDGSPIQKFSPIDLSPISYNSEKLCNISCSKMQIGTPLRVVENVKSPDKTNQTPNAKRFSVECFKVFESPKMISGIRRHRKRRRSLSQDMNMSVSYSSFVTKHKGSTLKRSFEELSQMMIDNSNDFSNNQDTGYQTESANCITFGIEKNFINSSMYYT